MADIATICWARTSSGLRGTRVVSISPRSIRSTTTAVSSRSPRYLGKMVPFDGSPTEGPARPIRWIPLAALVGDSTWMTRSTAPMSVPSSWLEGQGGGLALQIRHILDRDLDRDLHWLDPAGVDDGDLAVGAAQKACGFGQWALGRRQPDALRLRPRDGSQSFKAEGEVRTPLGLRH